MVAGSTNVELRIEWTISWALNSIGIDPAGQFYVRLQPANLETLRDGVWQPDVNVYREMIERVKQGYCSLSLFQRYERAISFPTKLIVLPLGMCHKFPDAIKVATLIYNKATWIELSH
jgi:hypothetical protein